MSVAGASAWFAMLRTSVLRAVGKSLVFRCGSPTLSVEAQAAPSWMRFELKLASAQFTVVSRLKMLLAITGRADAATLA